LLTTSIGLIECKNTLMRNGNTKSVKSQLKYYDNRKMLEVLPDDQKKWIIMYKYWRFIKGVKKGLQKD